MSGYYDTYRGVVLDTADPLDQRRLLVQVPEVAADESAWAVAEHASGIIPSVGDLVSVRYENGDENHPFWSAELLPPADEPAHGHYLGTYAGVVIDNVDPGGYQRLLVQVPDIAPDAMWAMPGEPGRPTPAVGDGAWIRFDAGDATRPLWSA